MPPVLCSAGACYGFCAARAVRPAQRRRRHRGTADCGKPVRSCGRARRAFRAARRRARPCASARAGSAPKKIVVADVPLADYLRTVAPGVEIVGVPGLRNYAAMADVVAGADVLIGLCTPEIVARGTSLKWIQLLNAGADSCATIPAVAQRGILVTNLQRIQGPAHGRARDRVAAVAGARVAGLRRRAERRRVHARLSRDARRAADRDRGQDAARRRPGRHRHGSREARARARHARDRDAQQPPRRARLRRVRRVSPTSTARSRRAPTSS